MPIATHTLTGNFDALVGEVSTIRATVQTNSTDNSWINDTDNKVVLGGALLTLDSAGAFSIVLPTSTGTGLQYQVQAEFVDADRTRKSWSSGWFPMTADADLADKANDSTLRITQTLGEALDARIDALEAGGGTEVLAAQAYGYENHGDVSGAVTFDGPTASHRFSATGPTTITLGGYSEGMVATLICFSGADDVTVANAGDVTLADGTAWSAELAMGAWISGGGGGEPAVPDTTPPSAVTDLAVTPDAEGTTATATFSPATDAESTVKYRYRLYPTGTTAPAWPTTGAQYNLTGSPINLTGLTVGEGYTMDLQAYSAGGSAAADTATFTTPVPAGWNPADSIDFATVTAGQFATPKDFTTTGGRTLRATSSGSDVVVTGGKVKGEYTESPVGLEFPSTAPPTPSRVTAQYELVGTNASYPPYVALSVKMQTGGAGPTVGFNWQAGSGHRLILGHSYGTGVTYTAGPGYTIVNTNQIHGIPTAGLLRAEPDGQLLKVYIDDDLLITADFTNCDYGGFPNLLTGAPDRVEFQHDGAVHNLTWEEYTS